MGMERSEEGGVFSVGAWGGGRVGEVTRVKTGVKSGFVVSGTMDGSLQSR